MENVDELVNEKPKGNMLQNENRDDEPVPQNEGGVSHENVVRKEDENIPPQPAKKPD